MACVYCLTRQNKGALQPREPGTGSLGGGRTHYIEWGMANIPQQLRHFPSFRANRFPTHSFTSFSPSLLFAQVPLPAWSFANKYETASTFYSRQTAFCFNRIETGFFLPHFFASTLLSLECFLWLGPLYIYGCSRERLSSVGYNSTFMDAYKSLKLTPSNTFDIFVRRPHCFPL